jgi:indolepyruvate ferredoxin oxidoreductase alpha subunit
MDRQLLSGDEAVALAALHAGVALGTGYPGTPSTEILETFDTLGGRAQWAPNEKVALEVGLGAAFGGARTLVTMKHVGLNVAADPLFTAAYTGVTGALIVVTADDPGMASSQNEQDNRRYAVAAGLPMIEPSDSQEAYDFFFTAVEISERWHIPVLFRMTTRVCHSKSIVAGERSGPAPAAGGAASRPSRISSTTSIARVMIPANARPAHRGFAPSWPRSRPGARTRRRRPLARGVEPGCEPGGCSASASSPSGVSYLHAAEAAPGARILKIGLVNPLPLERCRAFAAVRRADRRRRGGRSGHRRRPPRRRHRGRVQGGDVSLRRAGRGARPPHRGRRHEPGARARSRQAAGALPGVPYHTVYATLKKHDCIVAGDIGCYTLGRPAAVSGHGYVRGMGASIGVGLGLRHVLPPDGSASRRLRHRRLHVRPLRESAASWRWPTTRRRPATWS